MDITTATKVALPGRLPVLGHAHRILRHPYAFLESASRHGDIVRFSVFGRRLYLLTHPDLVHRVVVGEAASLTQPATFTHALREAIPLALLALDGRAHRRERRLAQPLFHARETDRHVSVMRRRTAEYVDRWARAGSNDTVPEMTDLFFEAAVEQLFSVTAVPEKSRRVLKASRSPETLPMIRAVLPPPLRRLPVPGGRGYARDMAMSRTGADAILGIAREFDEPGASLFLSSVLSAHSGEGKDPRQAAQDHIMMLLGGSTGTIPLVASWALHEISRKTAAQQRIHEEVGRVLSDGPVTGENIGRLTYTAAVVAETLRLHSVPILSREVPAPAPLWGETIPAGSLIVYSPRTLQTDPRFFPDPTCFDPDRWLRAPDTRGARRIALPFGAGAHKCIGEPLALTNLVTFLATVCGVAHIRAVPGGRVREKAGWAIPKPAGLRLRATLR